MKVLSWFLDRTFLFQPLQNVSAVLQKPNPLYNQNADMVQKSASKTLPSTWSDPSVNISLDNLLPGMQPSKPQQPSLNTMIQQQSKLPQMPICVSDLLYSNIDDVHWGHIGYMWR